MSEQAPTGSRGQLRRLLPAQALPSPTTSWPPPTRARARASVPTACDECRKLKLRCSGERPACRRCTRRRVLCRYASRPGETPSQAFSRNYVDLQHRSTALEELVELLRNLPAAEAQNVLQRLRSGTDAVALVNLVKAGDALVQMFVSPETRYRYEFPYRKEMPEDCFRDNPYLDSLIYEAASLRSAEPSLERPRPAESGKPSSGEYYQSLYLKPFHAAQVIEPGLSDANLSAWTAVCDDDALMRRLLGAFLRCEYQFTAAFQKDLFLEDLAAGRSDFCSSLLVNIVLAYSCVCDERLQKRAEYWNPHTLTYCFLAEAKRIWELEADEPRITTIQTGILFSVFYNLSGLDEVGQAYRIQSVALARRLRLFDGAARADGEGARMQRGKAFAAWALYNWETLVAFSFLHPPLLKETPDWQLPDPFKDDQWYGTIWLKYPSDRVLVPSHLGHVLSARCRFRAIMNEFCQAAYSAGSSITIDKANELRLRLEGWYRGLPGPLLPRAIVLPGHLQLHIYHHHLLLTMYEGLLDAEETKQGPNPQQVTAEAKRHLQTLVRLYYLRHGFEAMDLFIVIPLMLTGYDCVAAIDERTPARELETLRSTLILAAQGLCSQRRNHYLAEALFRVIRGRMRPQEVALLREATAGDGGEAADRERAMTQAVRSHWPVCVVKKRADVDGHVLTELVRSYAHLNTDEEGSGGGG
ncbi:hypothetical protein CDD83_9795 [Cordyceps sp. RAO-2017]|nr:hypothetical protein CDD83_9795 [Cordyceps sp. RAO-2017]